MTLPKKGLRNITVERRKYAYSVTGTDGGLSLSIIPRSRQDNLLTAAFDYHSVPKNSKVLPNRISITSHLEGLTITGYVVRQVILYALATGWDPQLKGGLMRLGRLDDKIDLRLPHCDTNEDSD
ncbi:hypothetical protein CLV59_10741 [Chitinophaga dinghuensis]|uniref:Uncharacterized protein n=1 Tax=Chitinophaga dinghuensis TaxID=1539050 RepID=A0A327VPL6_9BACT|nr:hypothetical protein [Chitinophaga dinghuensis]RAJ77275.1 hypothetical protein CLV59_10741 [Chitinophaga dinghuensis]